jgi:ApbE superfamily uncharacterized protein (UPF0280 family)
VAGKRSDRHGGYEERKYRNLLLDQTLASFQVQAKETDLYIRATRDLSEAAYQSVLRHRYQLEQYILGRPDFLRTLVPVPPDEFAPLLVRRMISAGQLAGVGPMASVAGAVAEAVGQDLMAESEEIIVENGGDIFLRRSREVKVGIFAGKSPLSLRVGLVIPVAAHPWGVCTSSGTVGPSLSFGRADAVCILSPSASLADAAATAVGNLVSSPSDLERGLERARTIEGVSGAVIIAGEKLGAWGQVELTEIGSHDFRQGQRFENP